MSAADLTWQNRADRGQLLRAVARPDGALLVEGIAAKEGVLEYRHSDGRVTRELVTPEALRTGATTLGRAPVTLHHPAQNVTPETYQRDAVGDVDGEVQIDAGGYVKVRMAVRRKDAIDAVRSGTVELSPGYKVQIDPTPGVHPEFGRYDARQIARETNHLAIVDVARAGHEARIRTDAAEAVASIGYNGGKPAREASMNMRLIALLPLLGITSRVDSDDAACDAIGGALQARKDAEDAVGAKLAAETARADGLAADLATARADIAALKAADKARADKAERTDLEGVALLVGVDPSVHADSRALAAAIAGTTGVEVKADASADYVRGLVEVARTRADDAAGSGRAASVAAWQAASTGEVRGDQRGDGGPRPRNKRSNMADRWSGKPAGREG